MGVVRGDEATPAGHCKPRGQFLMLAIQGSRAGCLVRSEIASHCCQPLRVGRYEQCCIRPELQIFLAKARFSALNSIIVVDNSEQRVCRLKVLDSVGRLC